MKCSGINSRVPQWWTDKQKIETEISTKGGKMKSGMVNKKDEGM